MGYTVLALVQDFADRRGLPVPSAIIGANVKDARQFRALLNEVLREAGGFSPSVARKRSSFTAIAAQNQGPLTTLFPGCISIVEETFWNDSKSLMVLGPATDTDWAALQVVGNSGPEYTYAVFGGELYLTPTPAAGEVFTLTYRTKYGVQSSGGTLYEYPQADDDSFLFSDTTMSRGLDWAWKKEKGEAYSGEYLSFLAALADEGKKQGLSRVSLEPGAMEARPGIIIPAGNWPL